MRKVLAPELLWGRRGSRDERRFAPGGRAPVRDVLFQYNHAHRTIRPHNSAPHNSAVRADLFGSEKSSTISGLSKKWTNCIYVEG